MPKAHRTPGSKLETVLGIPDPGERQRALLDYASSLEVNADDAVRRDGGWDEDTLVVLIYAAEGVRRKRRLAATGLLVGGVIVAALVLSVIFILDHFLL